jgi:hypothetical protein
MKEPMREMREMRGFNGIGLREHHYIDLKRIITENIAAREMMETCVANPALEFGKDNRLSEVGEETGLAPIAAARHSLVAEAPKALIKSASELKVRSVHSDSQIPNPLS